MSTEWLAQLKEGDLVVRSHGYGLSTMEVQRVVRVTAAQIILPHGERYNRDRGRLIGAGRQYSTTEILPPTRVRLETIRRNRLVNSLSQEKWATLPLSVLEQVNAVLESHNQSKEQEG